MAYKKYIKKTKKYMKKYDKNKLKYAVSIPKTLNNSVNELYATCVYADYKNFSFTSSVPNLNMTYRLNSLYDPDYNSGLG